MGKELIDATKAWLLMGGKFDMVGFEFIVGYDHAVVLDVLLDAIFWDYIDEFGGGKVFPTLGQSWK